ncbi:MAG: penicillin-binding transpeptidase domain-containing protein [Planctomycetota bacterium]
MPSMFQRRLTVLAVAMAVVLVLLGLASARLTLGASHRDRLEKADDALVRERLIPTRRGRVLDRHGRVLAEDVPGWAVAVDYSVVSGDWPYKRALAEARAADRSRWAELDRFEREALVAEHQAKYDAQVDQLWQTLADVGGVEREAIDARLGEIMERVSEIATSHAARRQSRLAELSEEPVSWSDAFEPVMEQTWTHTVIEGLSEDRRTVVQAFIAEAERDAVRGDAGAESPLAVWREAELVRPSVRVRPFETLTVRMDRSGWPSAVRSEEPADVLVEGVGMHWVGTMRSVWAEDMQQRPVRSRDAAGRRLIDYGGYRTGDRIGAFGVERAAEDRLRGTRGLERVRLDTGDRATEPPPVPGRDVQLTLDIQLQAHLRAMLEGGAVVDGGTGERVSGLMSVQPWHRPWDDDAQRDAQVGRPLNGCVVVMEVESGDVLAAVSVPGMPMRLMRESPSLVFDNHLDAPYRNRAIRQSYEPGSTIKPIVAAAALADGRLGPHEEIDLSRGYLWEGKPTKYRDWIFKKKLLTFPPADVEFAIGRSSNVFFGILAQRLGRDRLVGWFERFGMGAATGLGFDDERAGILALPDGGWEYMAIGESGVEWTPVQSAAAYAALARDGAYLPPRIMGHTPAADSTRLGIGSASMDRVLAGMRMSANDDLGTTHHLSLLNREPIFNVEGVDVMAKSGTAEAAPLREVLRYDEAGYPIEWGRAVRSGDHAWVIALAGPAGEDRPTHVVAVVVEYGGSGGQVAGPIANQAIALLKQEGYL